MSEFTRYLRMGMVVFGVFALSACAPSEGGDAATSGSDLEDVLPLDSKGEGSEPKNRGAFAGGEVKPVASEVVPADAEVMPEADGVMPEADAVTPAGSEEVEH